MAFSQTSVPLIIPVENQVRELDPKLLLACIAAQRGFPSYIGFRREIHFHITRFPQGIYLSKSVTAASDLMFRIMRKLGHAIVAWDEEALVHLPAEIYYSRRLSPEAMANVSHFFAWGENNADLWRRYPHLPPEATIHASGNPRCDLLRPEMHSYYQDEVKAIREAHGDFILVNTNFNHVNAFTPVQNLFQACENPDPHSPFGRAAKGMTREYALGLHRFKSAMFEHFKEMIPALAKAFPNYNIIVRPHPTESQEPYRLLAAESERIKITNSGNVVPWLLATRVLIHNSCTTGAEAYMMRVPAITYRAFIDETYEFGFYRLPNLVSHQCFSLDELIEKIGKILAGELGPADGEDRRHLIEENVASHEGKLACERMMAVIEKMVADTDQWRSTGPLARIGGHIMVAARNAVKRYKASRPGSHNRPEFQKHRYPEVPLADIRDRAARFQQILGHDRELEIVPFLKQFFRIS
jgi:surface carbohydrate biosynthesis protein